MPVFFDNGRWRYQVTPIFRRHLVIDLTNGNQISCAHVEVDQLSRVFVALEQMPLTQKQRRKMTPKIYLAFILTVAKVGSVREIFLNQDPHIVAVTFGTMPD